jgi:hypothetical protein
VAVGEPLGYLFTGARTALVAYPLIVYSAVPWSGWLGLVCAAGILVGLLEPAGIKLAGSINAVAYVLWSLWLVALGVIILI